ncbi:GNAT family N-acetyltransferase [uncultured Maritalea sp.]|uniref:GNAT family N-acetyltransferase n=1 Tax=uncultured Maritalea sp. TaxID=757249 RepID=UPI0026127CE4|nr:GNAT family N-acetyltransferase [uncultured Maritalea sp.]
MKKPRIALGGLTEANQIEIREATIKDAPSLARLIDMAGEGIPDWLWRSMATPGQTSLDVGISRASRESGGFSYKNSIVAQLNDQVVGMMLGYIVADPQQEDVDAIGDLPEVFRPFVELEYHSIGTFYINAMAVFPGLRGCGIGRQLLQAARKKALLLGADYMSIQSFSQNHGAVRLYKDMGYVYEDSRPVLLHPCPPYYDGDVILLKRPV